MRIDRVALTRSRRGALRQICIALRRGRGQGHETVVQLLLHCDQEGIDNMDFDTVPVSGGELPAGFENV